MSATGKTDTPVILVVDDEAGVRDLLGDALRLGGYETFEATDGMAALTALRKRPANLLVIDINMPLMDGFELLKEVHGMELHMPFYMVSAYESSEFRTKAESLGATRFLSKPVDFHRLGEAVRQDLNLSEQ